MHKYIQLTVYIYACLWQTNVNFSTPFWRASAPQNYNHETNKCQHISHIREIERHAQMPESNCSVGVSERREIEYRLCTLLSKALFCKFLIIPPSTSRSMASFMSSRGCVSFIMRKTIPYVMTIPSSRLLKKVLLFSSNHFLISRKLSAPIWSKVIEMFWYRFAYVKHSSTWGQRIAFLKIAESSDLDVSETLPLIIKKNHYFSYFNICSNILIGSF
jgi:hypothetical protein